MLRALLLLLLGGASFAVAYVALDPSPATMAPATDPAPAIADATPAEAAGGALALAEPRVVRDVTPAEVTAGPAITGPLTRVEPEPEPESSPPAAEARVERVFKPLVASAALLVVRDREIRLAGILAPSAEQTCGESNWPCGLMARAALRRFIRGRAVECEVPAGAEEIPDPAVCRVGGESLSEWLVAQGWAESAGDAYAGLESSARQDGLGLWGADRPGAHEDVADSAPDNALPISARVSATP